MRLEEYRDLIALLKILSHPTRLALLEILRDGEECVCHMTTVLGLRQACVSQQLIALRQAGLVEDRRDGWRIYYRITRPEIFAIMDAARAAAGEPARAWPAWLASCPCPKCQEVAARQGAPAAAATCCHSGTRA
jgi:ArsR family transcriptional regulator